MFPHPELWHRKQAPKQFYYGYAPTVTCGTQQCGICRQCSIWEFEAKEDDIEILDDWVVDWERLRGEPSPSDVVKEDYGYKYVEVKLRKKVKVKEDCSHVLVRAQVPSEEDGSFESESRRLNNMAIRLEWKDF